MNGNKWRNGGLWMAIVSALLLAAQSIGAQLGYQITNELISHIMVGVNLVLTCLAAAGIVSNPSKGSGFKD
jgi:phi LC3 family holin